ncbi:hypothetical protein H8S37_03910 [Mediterraneibacter sp. NSJ-55]|uniref:Uncharacterized protein n=1 Tax=Mediterraneibacter hominis TaxID=2763054 RepID=A0A923RP34_9FIRM|nr:hypothetical protein [Mediterraneibacter hominis]MBC5688079.1 hypothetical protein [Mediterraneibacter hominis]
MNRLNNDDLISNDNFVKYLIESCDISKVNFDNCPYPCCKNLTICLGKTQGYCRKHILKKWKKGVCPMHTKVNKEKLKKENGEFSEQTN